MQKIIFPWLREGEEWFWDWILIRCAQNDLGPLYTQFTARFVLFKQSNAIAGLTGGRTQAITLAVVTTCKYK